MRARIHPFAAGMLLLLLLPLPLPLLLLPRGVFLCEARSKTTKKLRGRLNRHSSTWIARVVKTRVMAQSQRWGARGGSAKVCLLVVAEEISKVNAKGLSLPRKRRTTVLGERQERDNVTRLPECLGYISYARCNTQCLYSPQYAVRNATQLGSRAEQSRQCPAQQIGNAARKLCRTRQGSTPKHGGLRSRVRWMGRRKQASRAPYHLHTYSGQQEVY